MTGSTNTLKGAERTGMRTRKIAACGMFAAIAAVLMFFEFPLPVAPPFYKLDLSEIPVLIGTFAFGPIAGVVIEFLKIAVKTAIKGTSTAFVGEIANFVIGCSMVIPAGIIYKMNKSRKTAVVGLVTGTLVMAAAGAMINAFVLPPAYSAAYGMPLDAIIGMGTAVNASVKDVFTFVLICVAPFNLIKGVVVSVLTLFLYKRISRFVKGAGVGNA
jgi:riboflavin transporter FmnP